MYQQALRVALGLAVFRGDPADMPYSLPLLRLVAALAVLGSVLLLAPVTPLPLAFATGVGGAAGIVFFTRQLLRGRKLDNRFVQTATAQLLVGTLFALALWPAFVALAPAMQEIMQLMQAGQGAGGADGGAALRDALNNPEKKINAPIWAALWSDVVFFWSLAASARINRLAADLNKPSSWLLTLLSLFVLMGFVLIAQILVAIVFV